MKVNKVINLYKILADKDVADDLIKNVFPKDKLGSFLTHEELFDIKNKLYNRWVYKVDEDQDPDAYIPRNTMEQDVLIKHRIKVLTSIDNVMRNYGCEIVRYIKPKII